MPKNDREIRQQLREVMEERKRKQGHASDVPVYFEETGLPKVDNLSIYYVKLRRWNREHEVTLQIETLLSDVYQVDIKLLQTRADRPIDLSVFGLGDKPRRLS